ncbi:MAG TPA: D-alanine--D-alanine ligase [Bacteroidales bacterium]|nr:D-alanine--D-alanine ligase [Bacteroidales bacterium]HRZ49852.1 D-alanine--D-alanine ligase [Bacteroidales bacterium]
MKKNIAILAGGNSGEHQISLNSASLILEHIDPKKFAPYLVVINGSNWICRTPDGDYPLNISDFTVKTGGDNLRFDAVFNIIHGTPGEDGMIQGYFDMLGIPYTSSGRLTSALTFNKYMCSRFVSSAGCVSTADAVLIRKGAEVNPDDILAVTGLPCFVKPNNGGSSVGMTKVKVAEKLQAAIRKAMKHDTEVLVEAFVKGTEVTCGVFSDRGKMVVLPLTEIVSKREYFDFTAKYKGKSEEITPARIPGEAETDIKRISSILYRHLGCRGVVRFDYILTPEGPYFLEVNTIPGMSRESIIPQMLAHHGMALKDFITAMIKNVL